MLAELKPVRVLIRERAVHDIREWILPRSLDSVFVPLKQLRQENVVNIEAGVPALCEIRPYRCQFCIDGQKPEETQRRQDARIPGHRRYTAE